MTQTPAMEQVDSGSTPSPALPHGPIRADGPVLVFALLWPVQLIYIGPVLSAVSQAQIAEHFHDAQLAWFTLLPAIVGMLLTPLAVKSADVYGKRRILLGCLGVSALGALLAALAPTYSWMLFGRGAGGFSIPVYGLVFATVREIFPRQRAATATGLIGGATGSVLLFTPLLASLALDSLQFRALLWLLAAFTAAGLLPVLAFVPESAGRVQSAGFGWIGAVLLASSAALLAYALGAGINWGWSGVRFLGVIVISVLLAVAFALVERVSTAAAVRRAQPNPIWWIGAVFPLLGTIWTASHHRNAAETFVSWLIVGVGSGLTFAVWPVLVLTSATTREQGRIDGVQSMLLNLANALGIEVATIMLSRHAVLSRGAALRLDPGLRRGYLVLAAMIMLGLLVTFAVPRLRRPGPQDVSQV